ncbi:YfiR family protein [Sphingomonas sp. M1-B02]|uniref:YfiR family protein n=1 Tax=Sphingomonas sp. M1-B02 TaxID=3114300 RepID=UPI00223E9DC6|nr:YfiR family protein [Sphingomonas sp. S6-11]UZK67579.1 YfiR family protein [Sphingomonas sp. S6-11]
MSLTHPTLLPILSAALLLLSGGTARAQASEAAVKAAFLPKFVRYIELPANVQPATGQPYYLCVIGRDPYGALVDRAASSETIDGRNVAVRRFATANVPAVAGCHVAFVAGENDAQSAQMLSTLRRQSTLTITDARQGAARGMIHFVMAAGRVRFHIDDAAAASRGILISSRLLALAIDVKQRTP